MRAYHPVSILALVTATLTSGVLGDTIHVPDEQPTIQAAIDAALDGDDIIVSPGDYRGAGNKDLDFKGKRLALRCQKTGIRTCDIECEDNGRAFHFHSGETAASIVDGFRIVGGHALGAGGAILCEDHSGPTIKNCTISYNAAGSGGGIACIGSNPIIVGCEISGNVATFGGGVYAIDSNFALRSCTISSNAATPRAPFGSGSGGGIFTRRSHATIIDSTIMRNYTAGGGGGLYSDGNAVVTIVRTRIDGNVAGAGGGVAAFDNDVISDGLITIANSAVSNNVARYLGGGLSLSYARGLIIGSTFTRNYVEKAGGAISCYYCDATITNSILWSNVSSSAPELLLLNSDDSAGSEVRVLYSVVEGGAKSAVVETPSTLLWGPGNIDSDPLFPVGINEFRPLGASPCINAGDSGFNPDGGEADLDGHARVLCGRIDIGAYEFGIGDYDCNGVVDLVDFGFWASCLTGPQGSAYASACKAFDFDIDGKVDMRDFSGLQNIIR